MRPRLILAVGTLLLLFSGVVYGWSPDSRMVGQLNVNTATAEELQLLPGMTWETAQAMVEFRNASGPFAHIEDLQKVRGISARMIEEIRQYIVFQGKSNLQAWD